MYYIEGRYYDPAIGAYVDSSPISTVFDNVTVIGGLDRTGLLCNNVLELANNPYTVSTTVTLSMEEPPLTDTPDTNQGIPWWHWLIGGVLIAGIFTAFAIATVATGGAAIAVGGLVGTAIGFGGSIVSQGLTKGFGNLNPWQLLLDTGLGAMSGMLGGSGMNKATSAIFGAGLGFVGSAGSDLIAGQPINVGKMMFMLAVGGIIGGVTGAGATNAAKFEQLLSSGIGMSGTLSIATGVSRLLSVGASPLSIGGNIGGLAIESMSRAITSVSLGIATSALTGSFYDILSSILRGI